MKVDNLIFFGSIFIAFGMGMNIGSIPELNDSWFYGSVGFGLIFYSMYSKRDKEVKQNGKRKN